MRIRSWTGSATRARAVTGLARRAGMSVRSLHRHCLEELAPLGKPVYVTESGIATKDDRRRSQFLKDVIGQVWQAIEHGVDVRGYLHWTSMDNFEWAQGYSMQFGLIGVDLETQERTVKPSGELFGRIAKANAVPVD